MIGAVTNSGVLYLPAVAVVALIAGCCWVIQPRSDRRDLRSLRRNEKARKALRREAMRHG